MKQLNSISEIFKQILRTNDYNLKILSALTRSLTSNDEEITLNLLDSSDKIVTYKLPSFGKLRKQVNFISSSYDAILEVIKKGASSVTLNINNQTSDGTSSTNTTNVIVEPSTIQLSVKPTSFVPITNWEFDRLQSHKFFVKIDVSKYVHAYAKTVIYKKIRVNFPETKLKFWQDNFLNSKTPLNYLQTIELLKNEKLVTYDVEDDEVMLSPSELKYTSSFSISKLIKTFSSDLYTEYNTVTKYQFNNISYNDNSLDGVNSTKTLIKGDKLITYNGISEFTVLDIEYTIDGLYNVTLGLNRGTTNINIKNDVLTLISPILNKKEFKLFIKRDEHIILFLKAVDPFTNIASYNYGLGMAFDTKTLTGIDKVTLKTVTLDNYYVDNVVEDINDILVSNSKDDSVPASKGIVPEPPSITAKDLQVVRINNHLSDTNLDTVKRFLLQLTPLEIQITSLQEIVSDRYAYINANINSQDPIILEQVYEYTNEVQSLNEQLQALFRQKAQVEKDISNATLTLSSLNKKDFKYRVRGFFTIPLPKIEPTTGKKQETIQFKIGYRYLDLNNQPNQTVGFNLNDPFFQTQSAVYSEWMEFKTDIRKKKLNTTTGKYEWASELVNNDSVNINQIDIPINMNEKVEIRIKSISEAGFPTNLLESEWSPSVIIEFPKSLVSQDIELSLLVDKVNEIKLRKEISATLTSTVQATDVIIDQVKALSSTIVTLQQRISALENGI